MKVIINGMGCPVSGGRLVLEELIKALPTEASAKVIIPFKPQKGLSQGLIQYFYFNHKIWGTFLRPFIDLFINAYALLNRSYYIINLSNYGLTFTSRSILYYHNPILLDPNELKGFGKGRSNFLVRIALNQSLKKAALIIVQTNHIRKLMLNYLDFHKIKIKAEIQVVKPIHLISSDLHEDEITNESNEFRLIYPAKNFPHKNINLAVSAVKKLPKNVKLNLTTDEKKTDEKINFLGKISYPQLIDFFKNSHALLFTSERETLGLPMLEALEFGKPAVLPNLPYAREIYGDAGVYFDEFSPESIAQAITWLIQNYEETCNRVRKVKLDSLRIRKSWPQHWELISKYTR